MQAPNALILVILSYMVVVPMLPWFGRMCRPASLLSALLERLGLQQSWVMFTGSALQYTRFVWIRFHGRDGSHDDNRCGLHTLPSPHQSYVQHWIAASGVHRAAILDALLDHLPAFDLEDPPIALSVLQRSQAVYPPCAPLRRKQHTVELARTDLEVE